MIINRKNENKLTKMHKSGRIAAQCLEYISSLVKPGVSTIFLDEKACDFIQSTGSFSACTFYKGFPRSICTSVNDVVCHGIPSSYILQEGDIINVDVTVIHDGWHGDTSKTLPVGSISQKNKSLLYHAEQAMYQGIKYAKIGSCITDIGKNIEEYCQKNNYANVEEYCGHGIGRNFHEEPQVPNFFSSSFQKKIEDGMCFTVEPMLNIGEKKTFISSDGWTVRTLDGENSAQFEHTIGIFHEETIILTKL